MHTPETAVTPLTEQVDFGRMYRERLERVRAALRAHELAAALLFDALNIRYVSYPGQFVVFSLHMSTRWAFVPAEGTPVLWEWPDTMYLTPSWFEGEVRPAAGWQFFGAGPNTAAEARGVAEEFVDTLRERGLLGETIAVDRLETAGYIALTEAGIRIADAQPVIEKTRAVKTPDELTIMRRNARVTDDALRDMCAVLRPGITENQLWASFVGSALSAGAEWCDTRLLSSGQRTNPWWREATNKVVEEGELVGLDTDLIGEDGMLTDISRTYLCGDGPATDEQRRLHRIAYDFVHAAIPEFRPGRSFEELGQLLAPRLPQEFQHQRYPFIAHGVGIVDEYPAVKCDNHHGGELEAGMVMSVEAYVGAVGGKEGVKLEEQIVVSDEGPELLSSAPYDERLLS